MTLISDAAPPIANRRPSPGAGSKFVKVLTTTDHKVIGLLYLCTAFGFFIFSGLLAEIMRIELARPGLQVVSQEQYNSLFTMHGSIMMFLVAPPLAFGFTNFIMPLQIGAPDMSFPRLNAFSYWLYLFGGLTVVAGFLTPSGAASFGWFAYAPLNDIIHSPNIGSDLWIVGLITSGLGTILGSVNFSTTILTLRAPGMTMFRMPIFTWNILVTSILVLMA
ncbi:MAG: putative cytochrome c oxidase subunit 1-alpha, partial [Frankiales bacterium]|nr:putative cytochrome c oxidase subunit 1-alpha [Frankiales bacterium]